MKILVVGITPLPFRVYQTLQKKYELSVRSLDKGIVFQIAKAEYELVLIWAERLSVLMLKKTLSHLLSRFPQLPILVAGGHYTSKERAEILLAGARDCISAKVCAQELLTKLAIITYTGSPTNNLNNNPSTFQQGDFSFDFIRNLATYRDVVIPLNKKELQLLATLLHRRRALISRELLYETIWDSSPCSNSLEVYMSSLRRKIEKPFGLKLFETVKGLGYRVKNN